MSCCWLYEGDLEQVPEALMGDGWFRHSPRSLQAFVVELCAGVAPERRAAAYEVVAYAWLFAGRQPGGRFGAMVERGEDVALSIALPDGEPLELWVSRDGGYLNVALVGCGGPCSPHAQHPGGVVLGRARLRLEPQCGCGHHDGRPRPNRRQRRARRR